ncbi:MAG: DNA polymerase III subunit delta' [Thermodesulfobacteriota bacterium]
MDYDFSQLLGQQQARNLLHRSLASGRLAHAYLFQGPDGVGKQLFARTLAASVNCSSSDGLQACTTCGSCKKISSSNHPDVHLISPEKGTIKINQIRELIRLLSFAPYESAMRVVILEDIHTMRREAANSLLKTLEEPPPDNLLILTAEAGRDILDTIRSRCQVIPFYHLSRDETVTILNRHLADLQPDEAQLLARLCEGQPGRGMRFHNSDVLAIREELIELCSDPQLDSSKDTGRLLTAAEKMAGLKDDLTGLFGLLRLWLRDLLTAEISMPSGQPLEPASSKGWNFQQLFAKLTAINRAEKELQANCNRSLVCEVLLFKLQA